MEERSDDHEEGDDYLDTIDEVNRRSFGSHAARHHQVSSDEEERNNESSLLEFVDAV